MKHIKLLVISLVLLSSPLTTFALNVLSVADHHNLVCHEDHDDGADETGEESEEDGHSGCGH